MNTSLCKQILKLAFQAKFKKNFIHIHAINININYVHTLKYKTIQHIKKFYTKYIKNTIRVNER